MNDLIYFVLISNTIFECIYVHVYENFALPLLKPIEKS